VFVHLGHRRGKLLVEFGYENQSSEGEVVGHGDEQKNAANKMATTLPNQPVSEVPTAVASAVTCADCPSAAGTVTFTAHVARRFITVYSTTPIATRQVEPSCAPLRPDSTNSKTTVSSPNTAASSDGSLGSISSSFSATSPPPGRRTH
jgi:hypothetical protein